MKMLIGLIALLLLAACATTKPATRYWDNPSLDAMNDQEFQATFRKHRGYCRMVAESGAPAPQQIIPSFGENAGFASGWNMAQALSSGGNGKPDRLFGYCMESLGWMRVEKR